jgi:hypothetical protein
MRRVIEATVLRRGTTPDLRDDLTRGDIHA